MLCIVMCGYQYVTYVVVDAIRVASPPDHSQLFNIAREKCEGLVSEITCMTMPIERTTLERCMSKVTKILSALVADSQ